MASVDVTQTIKLGFWWRDTDHKTWLLMTWYRPCHEVWRDASSPGTHQNEWCWRCMHPVQKRRRWTTLLQPNSWFCEEDKKNILIIGLLQANSWFRENKGTSVTKNKKRKRKKKEKRKKENDIIIGLLQANSWFCENKRTSLLVC